MLPINSTKRIKWGILGTSFISDLMAQAIKESETGELVAVASRSNQRAQEFALKHSLTTYYQDYAELLKEPSIDAVYIALPNHMHQEWILKGARARKHILCEKPLVSTTAQTLEIIAAVYEAKVLCMEALMYRHHPFIQEIKHIVDSQELGEIRHINAFYSANIAHLANAVAGGCIRNLGCYPLSLLQYLLDLEPIGVQCAVRRGDDTMARQASIMLQYPKYLTATLSTADDIEMAWHFDIFATKAHLQIVSNPWLPGQSGNLAVLIDKHGQIIKHITTEANKSLYCYQIDALGRAIEQNSSASATLYL